MSEITPKEDSKEKISPFKKWNGTTLKALGIAALLILLLIPLAMIGSLLTERENRRSVVENEVLYSWGGVTTVAGPVLQIPYIDRIERNYINEEGEKKNYMEEVEGSLFLIPRENKIDLRLMGEERTRAIYKIPLYRSTFIMDGTFDLSSVDDFREDYREIFFEDARILFSSSDISGLSQISDLDWKGNQIPFKPDPHSYLLSDQIAARVTLKNSDNLYQYHLDFTMQGGRSLFIIPTAEQVQMKMEANWSGLSFIGKFLPTEHFQNEDSFEALWQINYLSAGIPAIWDIKDIESIGIQESSFGIAMVDRVSVYLKNRRAQKYGILFLIIPFLTFFVFELITKAKIHPLQYLLAGSANIVFYLLLLSVSEHLSFNAAYGIASLSVTLLISLYSLSVFKDRGKIWLMPLILILSYFYLFNVLQSEDYALLMGSIGLFGILAAVMLITRKINWNSRISQE